MVALVRVFAGDAFGVTKSPGEDRCDRALGMGDTGGLLLFEILTLPLRPFARTGMSSSSSLLVTVALADTLLFRPSFFCASPASLLAAKRFFIRSYAAPLSLSSSSSAL
jgi:hypothetical protein